MLNERLKQETTTEQAVKCESEGLCACIKCAIECMVGQCKGMRHAGTEVTLAARPQNTAARSKRGGKKLYVLDNSNWHTVPPTSAQHLSATINVVCLWSI